MIRLFMTGSCWVTLQSFYLTSQHTMSKTVKGQLFSMLYNFILIMQLLEKKEIYLYN